MELKKKMLEAQEMEDPPLRGLKKKFLFDSTLGLFFGLLAFMSFSFMQWIEKELIQKQDISPWGILYCQSLITVLCNIILTACTSLSILSVPEKLQIYIWKRIGMGVLAWIAAMLIAREDLVKEKLNEGMLIYCGYSLICLILARFVVQESLGYLEISFGCVAYMGVGLIAYDYQSGSAAARSFSWLTIFLCAFSIFANALSDLYAKAVIQDVSLTAPPTYLSIGCGLVAPAMQVAFSKSVEANIDYTFEICLQIILVGLLSFLGQLLLMLGYRYDKAGRIALLAYIQAIIKPLLDLIVFGMQPSTLAYLGMLLIAVCICGVIICRGYDKGMDTQEFLHWIKI